MKRDKIKFDIFSPIIPKMANKVIENIVLFHVFANY